MLGGAVFGPVLHCWYRWLDAALPGAAARTVAAKVALDLAVFALPYYAAFYLGLNLLAGVALKVGHHMVTIKVSMKFHRAQYLEPTRALSHFWRIYLDTILDLHMGSWL